jgi:hypothetical protein
MESEVLGGGILTRLVINLYCFDFYQLLSSKFQSNYSVQSTVQVLSPWIQRPPITIYGDVWPVYGWLAFTKLFSSSSLLSPSNAFTSFSLTVHQSITLYRDWSFISWVLWYLRVGWLLNSRSVGLAGRIHHEQCDYPSESSSVDYEGLVTGVYSLQERLGVGTAEASDKVAGGGWDFHRRGAWLGRICVALWRRNIFSGSALLRPLPQRYREASTPLPVYRVSESNTLPTEASAVTTDWWGLSSFRLWYLPGKDFWTLSHDTSDTGRRTLETFFAKSSWRSHPDQIAFFLPSLWIPERTVCVRCWHRVGSEQALAPVRLPDTFAEGACFRVTDFRALVIGL